MLKEELHVSRKDTSSSFHIASAKQALQIMIDLFEDYLPLGSVVDLDKEKLGSTLELAQTEHFRVVINQRLSALPDTPVYFSYGGLIYPVGAFEGAESIYFSSDLISDVVHTGYSDESDLAYLALMKTELVIKRSYTSFYLAPKELKQEAIKELTRKQNKGQYGNH
jgi:hypothetical protein